MKMMLGSIKVSFEVHGHEYKVKPGIKVVIFSRNIHLSRCGHRTDGERDLTRAVVLIKP